MLLCRRHHMAIHEEGFTVSSTTGIAFRLAVPPTRRHPDPRQPHCDSTIDSDPPAPQPPWIPRTSGLDGAGERFSLADSVAAFCGAPEPQESSSNRCRHDSPLERWSSGARTGRRWRPPGRRVSQRPATGRGVPRQPGAGLHGRGPGGGRPGRAAPPGRAVALPGTARAPGRPRPGRPDRSSRSRPRWRRIAPGVEILRPGVVACSARGPGRYFGIREAAAEKDRRRRSRRWTSSAGSASPMCSRWPCWPRTGVDRARRGGSAAFCAPLPITELASDPAIARPSGRR